jgi:hypothetical protein
MEVVLVEALAAVLDQLSDMADRVSGEAYLETARRPGSVRRLLALIGFDAVRLAAARGEIVASGDPEADARALEDLWMRRPHLMQRDREEGPRRIHDQHRMVTLRDHSLRLQEHPLVLRAHAWSQWSGSWETIRVACICWSSALLDEPVPLRDPGEAEFLRGEISRFHRERDLPVPTMSGPDGEETIRSILRPFLEAYRMAGREVLLEDAVLTGIALSLSVRVAPAYYRSEVRRAAERALGTGPGGFFEPGRLRFGEDIHAGDIYQLLMSLDGVENVCLNRFKKIGGQYPDESVSGRIRLQGLQVGVCENDPARPQRGYYRFVLHGGLRG